MFTGDIAHNYVIIAPITSSVLEQISVFKQTVADPLASYILLADVTHLRAVYRFFLPVNAR